MSVYHVFIDGAADGTDAGTERLAQAIAGRYGLPVDSLRVRLASGRFRVKGNCDRATAESYAADLRRIGATCSIEEASPQNQSLTPLPFPAPVVQSPSKPALAPVLPSRTATQPLSRPSAPAATQYQSGLAAAFAGEASEAADTQLGALGGGDAVFTLAAIDGSEDAPAAPSHAFAPSPPSEAASSFGPPADADYEESLEPEPDAPGEQSAGSGGGEGLDLFAPPEAAEANLSVDLDPEEEERVAARKRMSAVVEAVTPPEPSASVGPYTPPALSAPDASAPKRRVNPLANERVRFVLGVVVALLVGFVPAHIVASVREKSAYAEIDAKVIAAQDAADSAESYAALDQFRHGLLERKYDDRQGIAMIALFIWGAAGGAAAYVWFRRVRWEQWFEAV